MNTQEQIQHLSQETVGRVAVAIGGGGSVVDYLIEWSWAVDLFIKYGNAVLLAGGIYLMFINRINKRRTRRTEDQAEE